jgi:hypothetical protein
LLGRRSPSRISFARAGQSFLACRPLGDYRRFKRLDERNDAGRRRLGVRIEEVAKVEKTRHAVMAPLAVRLGEIDRLV